MSEVELGYIDPKFNNIKSNAYWSRVHIDTMFWPSEDGKSTYTAHVQDCIDNPTRGLIARRKYITGKPMNYPDYAKRNKLIFDVQPDVAVLNKTLKKNINKMYKKTKYARSYIINSDRVALDYVKKGKEYTKFDKAIILLKRLFHRV